MVSLNQLFAPTANSIQNLVAFSRSIGVFKTCFFICDAKSAVSIKNVKLNYKFCHLIVYLNSIRQCGKTSTAILAKDLFLSNFSSHFSLFSSSLLCSLHLSPGAVPHSNQVSTFTHAHSFWKESGFRWCTLLAPPAVLTLVCRTPPPQPHLLALKRS